MAGKGGRTEVLGNGRNTYCMVCGKAKHSPLRWIVSFRKVTCKCGKVHLVCQECYNTLAGDWKIVHTKSGKTWLSCIGDCPKTREGLTSLRVLLELMR